MLLTVVLTFILVCLCVAAHYEGLRFLSAILPNLRIAHRARLLVVVSAIFFMHFIEISFFAFGFVVLRNVFVSGDLVGTFDGSFHDFWYFSAASYTTLGIGDVLPIGSTRILSSIEALVGLLMVAWSWSFFYLAMKDHWELHRRTRKKK